jgi:hypothetical protein
VEAKEAKAWLTHQVTAGRYNLCNPVETRGLKAPGGFNPC